MALILDDDSLLDAADGFAGWDDALEDDTLAQELEQGVVVTIFPDAGYRYLSETGLWGE